MFVQLPAGPPGPHPTLFDMFKGFRFQVCMDRLERGISGRAFIAHHYAPTDEACTAIEWYSYSEMAESALKAGGRYVPAELRVLLVRISGGDPFTYGQILEAEDLLRRVRGDRPWKVALFET